MLELVIQTRGRKSPVWNAWKKLGDTVIIAETDQSTASEKAKEESVNYTAKKINRLTCTHPACTRNGTKPTHTNEECYIRHPDQYPDEVKEIYDKIREKFCKMSRY